MHSPIKAKEKVHPYYSFPIQKTFPSLNMCNLPKFGQKLKRSQHQQHGLIVRDWKYVKPNSRIHQAHYISSPTKKRRCQRHGLFAGYRLLLSGQGRLAHTTSPPWHRDCREVFRQGKMPCAKLASRNHLRWNQKRTQEVGWVCASQMADCLPILWTFRFHSKLYKAGMVVCVYNPSTQEKAGKTEVQNHLWLHSEFLAGTGYMRPHVMNVCVARECGSMRVCGVELHTKLTLCK